ncbi:MAG: hypothetical protein ACI978_001136 [Oleispira sp.]|jgi:hypothetical protein
MNKYLKLYLMTFLLASSSAMANWWDFEKSNDLGLQSVFTFFDSKSKIEKALKSKDLRTKSNALIVCLTAWEHADGSYGVEISSTFMDLWVTDPILLSTWFVNNPGRRDRWLENQDYIFNGLINVFGAKHVNSLKENMLLKFKSLESGSYNQDKFFEEYINILDKLKLTKYNN